MKKLCFVLDRALRRCHSLALGLERGRCARSGNDRPAGNSPFKRPAEWLLSEPAPTRVPDPQRSSGASAFEFGSQPTGGRPKADPADVWDGANADLAGQPIADPKSCRRQFVG